MAIPHFEKIIDDSFGLWITGLFGAISAHNPHITFEQHKQYFFEVLAILLETGRAKFIHANADCYISSNQKPRLTINDPEAHWNVPTNEIILSKIKMAETRGI